MQAKRGLRHKEQVSYEISSDSEDAGRASGESTFSSPEKPTRKRVSIVDLEDDDEPEEIEPPRTPPPRLSAAGHALRQPKELHLSLRAQENGDKPVSKKRKLNHKASTKKSKVILKEAPRTARNEVRDHIATETAGKRASFFVAQKDLFLPLLPEGNHIQRLVAQRTEKKDLSVPYEVLEQQPKG